MKTCINCHETIKGKEWHDMIQKGVCIVILNGKEIGVEVRELAEDESIKL